MNTSQCTYVYMYVLLVVNFLYVCTYVETKEIDCNIDRCRYMVYILYLYQVGRGGGARREGGGRHYDYSTCTYRYRTRATCTVPGTVLVPVC